MTDRERATYATPEDAARAYAEAAGVRLANASASARHMVGKGIIVADGEVWRLTSVPAPRRRRRSIEAK